VSSGEAQRCASALRDVLVTHYLAPQVSPPFSPVLISVFRQSRSARLRAGERLGVLSAHAANGFRAREQTLEPASANDPDGRLPEARCRETLVTPPSDLSWRD